MNNRKKIVTFLEEIHLANHKLKELVDDASDQELEDILTYRFELFASNIYVNFMFMRMIISRKKENGITNKGNEQNMSNEALEKYFEDHWDWVVSDM